MSDLISRKALCEFCLNTKDRTVDANDIMRFPSAEPEWKWIPVTKALPWNGTNVLVTVRDDSGDTPWEYTSVGWRTPAGQYWIVDNEICYGVIAWMPLPEPWRDEE